MAGTQDFIADPRNDHVIVSVNGNLTPRAQATISIFDAGFSMGDGVWEGIRLHKGALVFLDFHLDRLFAGAAAIGLDIGLNREGLAAAIWRCLDANSMTDGAHVRLMVTRGVKSTINQDPRNALGRASIVIFAEYKAPLVTARAVGLHLHTASIRCTPAHMFDMRINSHSRLNLIIALLEAIKAGADEALMLDPYDHVSSCNATNFFWVRRGVVYTSSGAFCFNGITRDHVIALCRRHAVEIHISDFALAHVHGADEAFVTGTTGAVASVRRIDETIFADAPGPVTTRLAGLYANLKDHYAATRLRP